jgi:archaellum component FlaC
MEFNNKLAEASKEVSATNSFSTDKVILKSTERASINTLTNTVKIDVTKASVDSVLVTHDVKDLLGAFDSSSIKRSLVNIYGKDGRLHASSRNIESIQIPLSQYPARLEYDLTVVENGIEVEYKLSQQLPTEPTTILASTTGKSTSSKSELTIPEAIVTIDDEITKFKNNLESFSFIYDNNQNKVVSLHSYLQSLNIKIDNLTKELADATKEIKTLQNL